VSQIFLFLSLTRATRPTSDNSVQDTTHDDSIPPSPSHNLLDCLQVLVRPLGFSFGFPFELLAIPPPFLDICIFPIDFLKNGREFVPSPFFKLMISVYPYPPADFLPQPIILTLRRPLVMLQSISSCILRDPLDSTAPTPPIFTPTLRPPLSFRRPTGATLFPPFSERVNILQTLRVALHRFFLALPMFYVTPLPPPAPPHWPLMRFLRVLLTNLRWFSPLS